MSKHTSGPWITDGIIIYAEDDRRTDIALTFPPRTVDAPQTQEECSANARLISAAPDLLEGLNEACETICELCKRLNPQHENCDYCQEMEERKAAIAKARGEGK